MLQAATEGLVDFQTADLQDTAWWRSLFLRLERLETGNHQQVLTWRLAHYHAMLGSPKISDDSFRNMRDAALQQLTKLSKILFPWLALDEDDENRRDAVDTLSQGWQAIWGDPHDPEVARRIQSTANALLKVSA
jgi:hypothetical protein